MLMTNRLDRVCQHDNMSEVLVDTNVAVEKEQASGRVARGWAAAALFPAEWKKAAGWAIAVWAAALGLFHHTAWLIVTTWVGSRTFSHGFLIVPIFLYLVWIRADRLMALRPRPAYWMAGILALLTGIWLLSSLGHVRVVQEFALLGMLEAMIWMVLGTAVVRALWFPLLFLFFAVPFGESAIGPLQDFTAHFAVGCLRLSQVPVILEHRTIWVPSGPWIVAEACSGIRYLISSLVLGLVYASLVYRSRRRRALFVLASVAVPIVANGIRAYGIILLAYVTNNRLAVGVDHIIYGWVFFTAVQLLLFSLGLRWHEAAAPAPANQEMLAGDTRKTSSSRGIAAAAVCAMFLAGVASASEAYLAKRASVDSPQPFLAVSAPWQAVDSLGHGWAPLLHSPSQMSSSYQSGGHVVDVYLAQYSAAKAVELVSGYNQITDARVWSENTGGFRTITMQGGTATVRWDIIESPTASRLVWRWYWIDGLPSADATQVKLAQAKARLLARPTTVTVAAVSAEYLSDPSQAASDLQAFLNHAFLTFPPAK
jgi:exosortase A